MCIHNEPRKRTFTEKTADFFSGQRGVKPATIALRRDGDLVAALVVNALDEQAVAIGLADLKAWHKGEYTRVDLSSVNRVRRNARRAAISEDIGTVKRRNVPESVDLDAGSFERFLLTSIRYGYLPAPTLQAAA